MARIKSNSANITPYLMQHPCSTLVLSFLTLRRARKLLNIFIAHVIKSPGLLRNCRILFLTIYWTELRTSTKLMNYTTVARKKLW